MYVREKQKPIKETDLEQKLLKRQDRFKILSDGRLIIDYDAPSVQADYRRLIKKLEKIEV